MTPHISMGSAVILDVVYNHLGPDGCVFARYAPDYFARHANEWGDGLNFDGPNSGPVREYLQLQRGATGSKSSGSMACGSMPRRAMHDTIRRARPRADWTPGARSGRSRRIVLIAENEPQDVRMIRPLDEGGYGLDALWNDDFHHSAVVAMTGRREAYFSDHRGTSPGVHLGGKVRLSVSGPALRVAEAGPRDANRGIEPASFVNFIENHDQLANCGDGSRMHATTTPGRYRAMSALFILMPGTPMLFQGQEFGASAPFLLFRRPPAGVGRCGSEGACRVPRAVSEPGLAGDAASLPVPHDPQTFERAILDWAEYDAHVASSASARGSDLRCGAAIAHFAEQRAGARGRCGARAGSVRAALLRDAVRRTSDCCA